MRAAVRVARVATRVRPSLVVDRVRRGAWSVRGGYSPRLDLSWRWDANEAREVRIEWPTRYRWPPQEIWLEPICRGLALHVPVMRSEIPQPSSAVVLIRVHKSAASYDVAIDYSDYPSIDHAIANRVLVYFKMQLSTGAAATDPTIVPGGYVAANPELERLLGRLRHLRRLDPRPIIYAPFSSTTEVRRRVIASFERAGVPYIGGSSRHLGAYLAGVARAAVCVDVPGKGPLCFRLVEYLAVGSPIVALRHHVELPVPLVDDCHLLYADTPEELVERSSELLRDPVRARRLGGAAADYFDRYLERRQLGAYYLHEILRAARDQSNPARMDLCGSATTSRSPATRPAPT